MPETRFLVVDNEGVIVNSFNDSSILDTATIEQLGRDLYQYPDVQHKQKLVLDFSNVKFLSSHALGILLTLNKKLAAIKGTLAICGLRSELMKVFTITSLDKMFKFYPDDAAALKSFGIHVK
jgi:anti-anti-sigma factor